MLKTIARYLKRKIIKSPPRHIAETLCRTELVSEMISRPYYQDKIDYFNMLEYRPSGHWTSNAMKQDKNNIAATFTTQYHKVHYGCGSNILDGWLNVDLGNLPGPKYKKVNLLNKHPFMNNSIHFGFAEDMFEHFSQAESIFFLCEVYRTLIPGGVIRLGFPGLEGVLLRHYSPATEERINRGEFEAYHFWDHLHFYSKAELSLVAAHIGFKKINFVEFGKSKYPQLCNLDTRIDQADLNIFAELVK